MSDATTETERQTLAVEQALSYTHLYNMSPMARIRLIRDGVPTAIVSQMGDDLGINRKMLREALNLKAARTRRHSLSASAGELVLGLARLIGQVEAMVQEAGDPTDFKPAVWLSGWLCAPLPALGGERAIDLLDTVEGQALVSRLLSQMQSGAYA